MLFVSKRGEGKKRAATHYSPGQHNRAIEVQEKALARGRGGEQSLRTATSATLTKGPGSSTRQASCEKGVGRCVGGGGQEGVGLYLRQLGTLAWRTRGLEHNKAMEMLEKPLAIMLEAGNRSKAGMALHLMAVLPLCIMWGQPDKAEEARQAASPTPKPTPHPVLCAALIIAPNLPQSGMITQ